MLLLIDPQLDGNTAICDRIRMSRGSDVGGRAGRPDRFWIDVVVLGDSFGCSMLRPAEESNFAYHRILSGPIGRDSHAVNLIIVTISEGVAELGRPIAGYVRPSGRFRHVLELPEQRVAMNDVQAADENEVRQAQTLGLARPAAAEAAADSAAAASGSE